MDNPEDKPADQPMEASTPGGTSPGASAPVRSLRVWPALMLVAAIWAVRIAPSLTDEPSMALMMASFMGPMAACALIAIWWLALSRATLKERLIGFVGLTIVMLVANSLADKSASGFMFLMFSIPWGMTAFVLTLFLLRSGTAPLRTWVALVTATIGLGYWDLVRTDEIRGDFATKRNWRWQPTAEDEFLDQIAARGASESSLPLPELGTPQWPEFRGPNRDGIQPGVTLDEDWDANPPKELWRIPVGPGWSSFAVAGNRIFTQEQRGENEVVVCYDGRNGEQIWVHEYPSRFWEVVGGAGPRATPTLSEGSLYAYGANGELRRLDAASGSLIWEHDTREDSGREPPQWGFSSSPLVSDGLVIVHAGGEGDKGLLAYDIDAGQLKWTAASGNDSYSSPHLATLGGEQRLLMLTNRELGAYDVATGELVGEHAWQYEGYRVVQPLVFGEGSILLGSPMGTGTRRVDSEWDEDELLFEEQWTSTRLCPYFNDYVVHQGHLYGFDNNIFACLDLEQGKRKWKGGRYGNGQVLLLPERDQLLVITEDGELVLLRATPDKHLELAKYRALDGRTWNHHVLVGNRLYVRNAEEAAGFELTLVAANEE